MRLITLILFQEQRFKSVANVGYKQLPIGETLGPDEVSGISQERLPAGSYKNHQYIQFECRPTYCLESICILETTKWLCLHRLGTRSK